MLRLLRIKLSPPLRHNKSITSNFPSSSSSSKEAAADPSTIAAFLEDSCGLSSRAALAIANNRPIKSTAKARSVLTLLESHGFRQGDIARILARDPGILSMNPEKVAKPKLAFLQSVDLLELFL